MFYNHPTIMLPPTTATAVATTLPTEAITVVILATDPVLKNRWLIRHLLINQRFFLSGTVHVLLPVSAHWLYEFLFSVPVKHAFAISGSD
jgi:hypothetical protein